MFSLISSTNFIPTQDQDSPDDGQNGVDVNRVSSVEWKDARTDQVLESSQSKPMRQLNHS